MTKVAAAEELATHEDFANQDTWIKETVLKAGHQCIFLPKFHPEFNWIERYWGANKRFTRSHCTYKWDHLQEIVPQALDNPEVCSLAMMRKFARKSYRYMDAYDVVNGQRLSPQQVEYSMKKYKSHRSVRDRLTPQDMVAIENLHA